MLPETLPAPRKRKTNGGGGGGGGGRPLGGGGGGRGRGGWVRVNGHWTVPIHEPIDRKWMQADAQVGYWVLDSLGGGECVWM